MANPFSSFSAFLGEYHDTQKQASDNNNNNNSVNNNNNSKFTSRPLSSKPIGIDGLSPHTDAVVATQQQQQQQGFTSCSPIGDIFPQSRSAPAHIVGLFGPMERSNDFMKSLALSPSAYSPDKGELDYSSDSDDDDFSLPPSLVNDYNEEIFSADYEPPVQPPVDRVMNSPLMSNSPSTFLFTNSPTSSPMMHSNPFISSPLSTSSHLTSLSIPPFTSNHSLNNSGNNLLNNGNPNTTLNHHSPHLHSHHHPHLSQTPPPSIASVLNSSSSSSSSSSFPSSSSSPSLSSSSSSNNNHYHHVAAASANNTSHQKIPNSPLLSQNNYADDSYDDNYSSDSYSHSDSPNFSEDMTSPSSTGQYGEHPFGEHPSRTLFVRNINSNVEDDELRQLFEAYGAIRSMYTQCKHRGFVMISYFDIRHAKSAMRHLQSKVIRRRKLDIHYSIPKDNPSEKDQNQGTLVVFNLDPSITCDELRKIFGSFGEIKEIRETPNKKHHKFIEFYDVRDAEKAMKSLNKTEIKSKKIKIEPSRPGGARKNLINQLNSPELNSSSDDFDSYSPSTAEHLYSQVNQNDLTFTNFPLTRSPNSLTPLSPKQKPLNNIASPNISSSSASSSASSPSPSLLSSSASSISNSLPSSSLPPSSSSSSSSVDPHFEAYSLFNSSPIQSQKSPQSMQPHRPRRSSELQKKTYPSPRSSPWSPTLYPSSPSSIPLNPSNHLTLSSSSINNNNNANLALNNNIIINNINHTNASLLSSPSPSSSSSSTTASMMMMMGGTSPLLGGPPTSSTGHKASRSYSLPVKMNNNPALNPHTATNNNNNNNNMIANDSTSSLVDKQNFDQSSSSSLSSSEKPKRSLHHKEDDKNVSYALDIESVLNGSERRTTLMIKNIPNKYTQKMLLATVDEHHKGLYDFFYLPIDFKNKCNVGYAFINFIDPVSIVSLYRQLHNNKWEKFNSEKVCEITYARIQGKDSLISHFQNSSLMSEDKKCRPIIFHSDGPNQGQQAPFPIGPNVRVRSRPINQKVQSNTVENGKPSERTTPARIRSYSYK